MKTYQDPDQRPVLCTTSNAYFGNTIHDYNLIPTGYAYAWNLIAEQNRKHQQAKQNACLSACIAWHKALQTHVETICTSIIPQIIKIWSKA